MFAFVVLLAGAATMALWLKVTTLVQIADRPRSETSWDTVLPALALGALVGILAYVLWTRLAPRLATAASGGATTERLRLAWSFSDFPLAVYAALILPLDLALVGPEVFSTDSLQGDLATVWSAISTALLLATAVWSVFLFVRGVEAASGARGRAILPLLTSAAVAVWFFYVLILIKELFE